MDGESIVTKLREAGFPIERIARTGDDHAWHFKLANGAVIDRFDDGRCTVHGPSAAFLRMILRLRSLSQPSHVERPQPALS